jgi:hypothetical protein
MTVSQVRLFIVAAAFAAATAANAGQGSDKLEKRLLQMTQCVDDFVQRFVNVVAEERYEQRVTQPHRRRQLISDFLLVRPQGSVELFQFRDVLEVDGKPVRGHDERMTRLFLQPWETAFRQATAIAREGARYNVADIGTIDYPLDALGLLQTRFKDDFRFSLGGRDEITGQPVRVVNFQQRHVSTRGQAWIHEQTSCVMKTELRLGDARLGPRFVTSFAWDDVLQLNVPVEMRVWVSTRRDGEMQGMATYGRFRRFQVRTTEVIQPQPLGR